MIGAFGSVMNAADVAQLVPATEHGRRLHEKSWEYRAEFLQIAIEALDRRDRERRTPARSQTLQGAYRAVAMMALELVAEMQAGPARPA